MKGKIWVLVVLTLCAAGICIALAESSRARQPVAQSELASPDAAEQTIEKGLASLKAGRYEDAVRDAKQVLSTSTDVDARAKAYKLLVTAVRVGEGYDAAIRRAYGALAYAKKIDRISSTESTCLKNLISDLRQGREGYRTTIAEQQKIVKAHPGTTRAGEAALRIAQCKQYVGPRKDALAAYEKVAKDYAQTRPGWKAAQEVAWLRQAMSGERPAAQRSKTEASVGGQKVLEDGLRALREGRAQDAEKIARSILASPDRDRQDRTAAVEVRLRAVAARMGYKEATKQAWQMACGTSQFSPTYSDVLRLEAIATDLTKDAEHRAMLAKSKDEPAPVETVAKVDDKDADKETRQVAQAQDTGKARPRRSRPAQVAPPVTMAAVPLGGNPPPVFYGTPMPITGKPAQTGTTPRNPAPPRSEPTTPQPNEPEPVPGPGDPIVKPPPKQPIEPSPPPDEPEPAVLDRWTANQQYRDAQYDPQLVYPLIEEHLTVAEDLSTSPSAKQRRRGLGIALSAALCAVYKLNDIGLALDICALHLEPNFDDASAARWGYLGRMTVREKIVLIWWKANETEKIIDAYVKVLENQRRGNYADYVRFMLAALHYQNEDFGLAEAYLLDIDEEGALSGARTLAGSVQQAAVLQEAQRKSQGENGGIK